MATFKDETLQEKGMTCLLVGAPQTGKTTEIKRLLQPIPICNIAAFDLENEYPGVKKCQSINELALLGLKTYEKTLVIEDATAFLKRGSSVDFNLLLSKNKGHRGHNILINIHYLAATAAGILPFVDYFFLTKAYEKEKNIPYPLCNLTKSYQWVHISELFK